MQTFTRNMVGLLCSIPLAIGVGHSQITFVNSNNLLHDVNGLAGSNAGIRSGNSMTVIDVNNDGLDDILKLHDNRYVHIEYQQSGGTFTYQYVGDIGSTGPWSMSAADVDHNGYKDILIGGGSQAKLVKLNATGTGFLGGVINLPNGAIFCQNGNFMDANNDGWADIFMCNDVNENRIWINDGTGNFPVEQANSVINFNVTPGVSAPNDESGNYSSVWTDFDNDGDVDLFVAHCRQGQPAGDIRRTDRLFVNNGNGTYTEDGASYNLNSNDQDWTATFGDIDNDGDFDVFLTKHSGISKYYLNDGAGHMTEAGTIGFGSMPMQGYFEDFDNDGFIDLMVTGSDVHRLYRNNQAGGFIQVSNAAIGFATATGDMLAFACGDLNHDGKIDMYSGYGSTYNNPSGSRDDIYWRNTTSNSNHYLTLVLTGTSSNVGALGARAYIYGPWGVQTREVRASESYGTCNSFQLHFGLGSATTVDSINIIWPSGIETHIGSQPADQFISVTENQCTLAGVSASYTGATTFCNGDSLQLTAPTGPGYTYLWSNGQTTQSIYASSTDDYSVTVMAGPFCSSTSPAINIIVNPDETPSISVTGELMFCPGDSVMLTSSEAAGNTWSNQETTASIYVTQAGSYTVSYAGLCQSWTSAPVAVTLYAAPAPDAGADVYLPVPGSATLNATNNNAIVKWYDAPAGGTLLHTGNSFTTAVLNTTTSFYAEDAFTYGGGSDSVGSVNLAGSSFSSNTFNGWLVFNVIANCTLTSVEVNTDMAGTRVIEMRNSVGTVLASDTVNIPAGNSVITLNFPLTPGTGYQLGTNTAMNNSSLGVVAPRLLRDNSGTIPFPYDLAGFVSITGGNNGSGSANAYYYFYNWKVEIPADVVCESARDEVTVFVSNVGIPAVGGEHRITFFPNPATDYVNVQFTADKPMDASVALFDMAGRKLAGMDFGSVSGTVSRTVNTSGIASGAYSIALTIGTETYTSVLIIK